MAPAVVIGNTENSHCAPPRSTAKLASRLVLLAAWGTKIRFAAVPRPPGAASLFAEKRGKTGFTQPGPPRESPAASTGRRRRWRADGQSSCDRAAGQSCRAQRVNRLDHRHRRRIRHHGTLPVEVLSDVLEIDLLREDGRSSRADHWPVVNADGRWLRGYATSWPLTFFRVGSSPAMPSA